MASQSCYVKIVEYFVVQELQKEGAKALEIDKAGSQIGPVELQEEDNYVMCKSCDQW